MWKLTARALDGSWRRASDVVDLEWEAGATESLKGALMLMSIALLTNVIGGIGFFLKPPSIAAATCGCIVAIAAGYVAYLTQWTTVPNLLRSVPLSSSVMVRRLKLAEAIVAGITGLVPWALIVQIVAVQLAYLR